MEMVLVIAVLISAFGMFAFCVSVALFDGKGGGVTLCIGAFGVMVMMVAPIIGEFV